MSTDLPFELVYRGEGSWRGYWKAEKLMIEVFGTDEAPTAAFLATLTDAVARWAEVKQTVATFARSLASDHHVPLDPATIGGFAARSCGFDGDLYFQALAVSERDMPDRVVVIFYTGYPDGYATYEIVIDHGTPTGISAFAS